MQHAGEGIVQRVVVYRRELEVDWYRLVLYGDIAQVRQHAGLDVPEILWNARRM